MMERCSNEYTNRLERLAYGISPDDEDYVEKLKKAAASFRTFDMALDDFLLAQGYCGEISDIPEKIRYIQQRFNAAGIDIESRVIRNWYTNSVRGCEREYAFQFCFAFGLDYAQTQAFFRRVYLQRGIDCHTVREAVYYFAIRSGLSYREAQEILAKAPDESKAKKPVFHEDSLFTGSIVNVINSFSDAEELLHYLEQNIEQFSYHNVTAYRSIKSIWSKIVCFGGLAQQEMERFTCGDCEGFTSPIHENDPTPREREERQCKRSDCPRHAKNCRCGQCRKRLAGEYTLPNWRAFLHILGYTRFQTSDLQKSRTIKSILRDNPLLHPLAEANFPDRQGFEAVMRDEEKSYEVIRKILILAAFYEFWCRRLLDCKDILFQADRNDPERCLSQIDQYLLDAGYPQLYAGNPYDWIFFYAISNEDPLYAFREFMWELYLYKHGE